MSKSAWRRAAVGAAAVAAIASLLPDGAKAALSTPCRQVDDSIGVGGQPVQGQDVPRVQIDQHGNALRGAGHTVVLTATNPDAGHPQSCLYTPVVLQNSFAVWTNGAYRIYGYKLVNGVPRQRLLAAGGEATDVNRKATGTFTTTPGEQVVLQMWPKCQPVNGLPPVTIPGTGVGVDLGDEVCVTVGSITAWS